MPELRDILAGSSAGILSHWTGVPKVVALAVAVLMACRFTVQYVRGSAS
ncbi:MULTISPECIES: hypothetical protein [unclassified Streptomyces]